MPSNGAAILKEDKKPMTGMIQLILIVSCLEIIFALSYYAHRQTKLKIKSLTANRKFLSGTEELRAEFGDDVPPDVIEAMLSEIDSLIGQPTPIRASDRIVSEFGLDVQDVEDLMDDCARRLNIRYLPGAPTLLPADPTVRELLVILHKLAVKCSTGKC